MAVTSPISSDTRVADPVLIGSHVKDARKRSGQTLDQLSRISGVSISAISKIENGKTAASFDTLLSLCHALNLTFDALFADDVGAQLSARRAITHQADIAKFATAQYDYEVHAQELSRKKMIPLVMDIKNRVVDDRSKWSRHAGEEFIYVVSGELIFYTESYSPTRLSAGESAYIDSGMAHAFASVGDADARIVSVCLDSPSRVTNAFVSEQTQAR